jgi:glutathione S-transferase
LEAPVEQYMFNVLPNLPEKLLPKNDRTRVSSQEAQEWFDRVCQPLNNLLATQDYLVENRFSAADVVTGGVLFWALKLGMLNVESPVQSYISKLLSRPAFQKIDVEF